MAKGFRLDQSLLGAVHITPTGPLTKGTKGLGQIIGARELDRKLQYLSTGGSKKAVSAAINAGLTVVTKAIRAEIGNTPVTVRGKDSATVKREARKSIGKSFVRGGTDRMGKTTARVAKAGFAVAKKHKTLKQKGGGKTRGVGLSARDIHWFVLGTKERHQYSTGRKTGKIRAFLEDVIPKAMATSGGQVVTAIRDTTAKVITREARKKR